MLKALAVLLALVASARRLGVGAVRLGGAASVGELRPVHSLQPVSIGQNSFVYAADGSRLGSIPAAGGNREPVR